ncbi:putative receptor-type tyrosine-protein phosphatase epsilon [Apostichopus japonicus]|uniref:protein-tyrosine-phosphatase n=1 Tax=Stichopus japonicus TaxID=307972 RepID=A0A2G8KK93_STIJA|nr:putative receptor-type tyrosine-protein phosphatase epsilon [Apostichopus japonicus]
MGCHAKYPYKYEISYRSQNFTSVTTTLNQSQQEYKFTDLEPGSSYVFYLRLTNYAGRSGPYAVIECNTTVYADLLPFVLGVTGPSVFLIISLLVLVVYLIASPSRRSNLLSILSNKYWAIRRERIEDDNGFIEEEHAEMRTFERDQQIPNVCSSRGKTIHRHELPSYVKEQHLKGGFHDEYKELIQGKYMSCSVAEAKINERKNRFKNIITYDHSRVVLPLENGDHSTDYINASYIHGYKKQNAFIACQGPNKASLHDFWRMIWHEKCTKIIMVTLPVENGKIKCLTYWPDTEGAPQQYSSISVEKTGETASINLIIRRFKLQLGSSIHEVTQYHYFGWPDMKVPRSADILWNIIDEFEIDEDEKSPPIVVHCSAGCGRTGTVIALASLRKMMKQERAIDVFNFVNNMRKQRPLMVQVVEQYQFIYESLLIYSYVGKPSTPVDDFHVNLKKWKAVTSLHKPTGLQRQFNMLSFVNPFSEDSENQVGSLSENIVKNRYPAIIPRNKFRPSLMTFVEDKAATDYINASFCDGYSKKDLFISTQLPLPNTIVDFWRMVIDYEVATIVTFEADQLQTCLSYLPSEGANQYGPFSVRVVDLTQEDGITTREVCISMDHCTYQNKDGLRMVTNISLSLPSISSFVSLLEKTQAVQRQNQNRRIVVQCLDGVSQCGMFMAAYNCCTGIMVDKVIDLFTMVRKLRERRPEMVGTLEQYEFCTQAISKRLSTANVYANE